MSLFIYMTGEFGIWGGSNSNVIRVRFGWNLTLSAKQTACTTYYYWTQMSSLVTYMSEYHLWHTCPTMRHICLYPDHVDICVSLSDMYVINGILGWWVWDVRGERRGYCMVFRKFSGTIQVIFRKCSGIFLGCFRKTYGCVPRLSGKLPGHLRKIAP